MFLSKFIFLSAFGVLAIVVSVKSECCPCSSIFAGACADGSTCGIMYAPNFCCGYHTCNVACCDCGGGCRSSSDPGGVSTAISILDKNSSGDLDLKEFEDYNTENNIPNGVLIETIFKLMDANGDGRVSVEELTAANTPKRTGHGHSEL